MCQGPARRSSHSQQRTGLSRGLLQHNWGLGKKNQLSKHRQKWEINLNSCSWSLYLFLHYFMAWSFLWFGSPHWLVLFDCGFFEQKHLQFWVEELFSFFGMYMALRNTFMYTSKYAEQSVRTASVRGTSTDGMPLKDSCGTIIFGNPSLTKTLLFLQIDLLAQGLWWVFPETAQLNLKHWL